MLSEFSTRARRALTATACCVLVGAPAQRANARAGTEILTNEAVVQMLAGKLSKDLIVGKIGTTKPGFDLSSERLIMDEVLTNDIIVRMVTAKVPRSLILSKIQMSRSAHDIGAIGLVSLNTAQDPEEVIKAMRQPPPAIADKSSSGLANQATGATSR